MWAGGAVRILALAQEVVCTHMAVKHEPKIMAAIKFFGRELLWLQAFSRACCAWIDWWAALALKAFCSHCASAMLVTIIIDTNVPICRIAAQMVQKVKPDSSEPCFVVCWGGAAHQPYVMNSSATVTAVHRNDDSYPDRMCHARDAK